MTKKTLDSVIFLSIFYLKKIEKLTPGARTELSWEINKKIIQRTVVIVWDTYLEMVGGRIQFDRTPCHFGGERLWFLCPKCDRRCAVLYGSDFVCKACIGLAYGSQYEGGRERLRRKTQKLKQKAFGLNYPFFKFKGQHSSTYNKNLKQLFDLERQAVKMDTESINNLRIKLLDS